MTYEDFYVWDIVIRKEDGKQGLVVNDSYFKSSGEQTFVDVIFADGKMEHLHVSEIDHLVHDTGGNDYYIQFDIDSLKLERSRETYSTRNI